MDSKETSLKALTVLLKASRTLEKAVHQDIMTYQLNLTEFSVLELLYNKGPQPIQLIGKKILIASSSITYVIDKLEDKGFVVREPNKKDRRVTLVKLTEAGREKMDNIFPKHGESIDGLFSVLTIEEREELIDLLKKVGLNTDQILNG